MKDLINRERWRAELLGSLPGEEAQNRMAPSFRGDFPHESDPARAAVMALMYPSAGEIHMVFIKRNEYNGHHSAQVSFPGGAWENEDLTLQHTAIRETREELGISGELEILGDPGLSVSPADPVSRDESLVVISPAFTNGELWGESDERVFSAMGDFVTSLRREGRKVAYLSCYPGDDRFIMGIMRSSGSVDAEYVAAYADHEAGVGLLARAGVVVAERLHAAVVAAAVGTPFVGVEYRPKIRDFARSVDQQDLVIRSDEITAAKLAELVEQASDHESQKRLLASVETYRDRQKNAAARLAQILHE